MCLAVPMKIVKREGQRGVAELEGVTREVALHFVDAQVGDYVLVHAGFAIQKVDEESAQETIELFREMMAKGSPDERQTS